MLRFAAVLAFALLVPLMAWAVCTDCAGKSDHGTGCSCSVFKRYDGEAQLRGITITFKAESDCASGFMLLIRNDRMRKLAEIPLAGPHHGEQTLSFDLDSVAPARSVRMAVLVNQTQKDVKISYLKIVGQLTDGEFTYFEKACPGVVIGNGGCPRMALYEGR
jgi:hypothetical protein